MEMFREVSVSFQQKFHKISVRCGRVVHPAVGSPEKRDKRERQLAVAIYDRQSCGLLAIAAMRKSLPG